MSGRVESGVLDDGDRAGLLRDSFENHFRDMFLNVTHIKYYMHSYKVALKPLNSPSPLFENRLESTLFKLL